MLLSEIWTDRIFPLLVSKPLAPLFNDEVNNERLRIVQIYLECLPYRFVNKKCHEALTHLRGKIDEFTFDWKQLQQEVSKPWKVTVLKLFFFKLPLSQFPDIQEPLTKFVFVLINDAPIANTFGATIPNCGLEWMQLLLFVRHQLNKNGINIHQHHLNIIDERNEAYQTPLLCICKNLSTNSSSQYLTSLLDMVLEAEGNPKQALYERTYIRGIPYFKPIGYMDIIIITAQKNLHKCRHAS